MLGRRGISGYAGPSNWNSQGYGVVGSRSHTRHVLYGSWLLDVPIQRSSCWLCQSTYSKVVMVRVAESTTRSPSTGCEEHTVNNIVWWVGAIVIILAILGFLGFR